MTKNPLNLRLSEIISLEDTFEFYRERVMKYNDELKAFLQVSSMSDDKRQGFPFALKDNILAVGTRTTCGSRILENYESPYDATVTRRLVVKGGKLLGKTNLDEFAMGSSTENSAFGPSGLVSRYGLVAFASSLDQIGPMTRCSQDAADVMSMISGHDSNDSNTVRKELSFDVSLKGYLKGLKLAVPSEMLNYPGLDSGVKERFLSIVEDIRRSGAEVEEISIPSVEYAVATYYLIAPAEASSNLARYEGVRFGPRVPSEDYESLTNKNRDVGFGKEVKRRILLGTFTLSATYYDAYYRKALKTRSVMAGELNRVLDEYDFILNPSSPVIAPKIGEITDPLTYYLMDIYTIPANVAGLPSISLPAGLVDGMPVGVLLTGRRFSDVSLLDAAKGVEDLSPSYRSGLAVLPERWTE
ncbi:MAG: Glutamyl-tRNA(Gln) amidotransferase subunit A [Mesotoga infera]|uniref:Glutamyl-tRNA(Gln) amidotransferase subunit A n=1 Tax=Mesotoga infera TaxID=1236046 RepID=A0A101GWZ8_9BACT|nr:MAG: Glutamyl-tRNA(Gln) amidotransferase subunit A [Mesotoga infera]